MILLISWLLATSAAFALGHDGIHKIPGYLKSPRVSPFRGAFLRSAGGEDLQNIGDLAGDIGANRHTMPHEANSEFWLNLAQEEVKQRTTERKPFNAETKAKNIIMFLGDGMSYANVVAARIRQGQLKGHAGEEDALSFEKFPYVGLSKTYCANAQVPDSACTATAFLCGVKTNFASIGVNAQVKFNNCSESENVDNHVSSIATWAQQAGKATGFITTDSLTGASTAGLYAHSANRHWECDADIAQWGDHNDPTACTDIAQQLINEEPGRNFDLIMGGGMTKFVPRRLQDLHGNQGERSDDDNLLARWQGLHTGGVVVHNRQALLSMNVSKVSHILGLFQSGPFDYHDKADATKQPTLAEMTEKAIEFLTQKNPNGFFLFVEAAGIDTANHESRAALSLDETIELAKAVQKAVDLTRDDETLIVVTADHSHTLSIAGYPERGNNILGVNQHDTDINGLKYTTLNYATGGKQYLDETGYRWDVQDIFGHDLEAQYPSYIHTEEGTHGGDDVPVYAYGPQANLFQGIMEQHSIPHFMAYAACIGEEQALCNK